MRVVTDIQPTRQLLNVLLDRLSWCAPSPDVGSPTSTFGKIDDSEFLDEVSLAYLIPKLLSQTLLVDVEKVKSRGYSIFGLARTIVTPLRDSSPAVDDKQPCSPGEVCR